MSRQGGVPVSDQKRDCCLDSGSKPYKVHSDTILDLMANMATHDLQQGVQDIKS